DHPRISVKTFGVIARGWRQKLLYIFFFFFAIYWACRWRPVWIYASDPLASPVAWLIRKCFNINVVYHEHDSQNLDSAQTWFMKTVFSFRRRLAMDAELCVLPQRARLLQFVEVTKRSKAVYCVWNCPRLDEVTDVTSSEDQGLL